MADSTPSDPSRSTAVLPGAVPVPRTALIGRSKEMESVRDLLLVDAAPLVTLTGPGGAGKTRLALTIAHQVAPAFADPVAFVDLSPVRDAALVLPAIAQALRIRDAGDRPVSDLLNAALRSRQILLVLDNCEQVLAAAPELAALLAACPAVQILATSRAPMRVRDEHLVPVPPLGLPTSNVLQDLAKIDAVALFVQRAHAADPSFFLTEANAATVAEVCRRIEGMPLAIELAAARLRLLSPDALLALLDRRLRVLSNGGRDLPLRQRTIRDTIAWSYDLLSPEEQALFRRLAVFPGGFTIESAAAVAGAESDKVLDGIASLADASLVQSTPGTSTVGYPVPRFGMLETVREYALERLDLSGESSAVHRRHADHILRLVEDLNEESFRSGLSRLAMDPIEVEHANIRAALSFFVQAGAAAAELRLVGLLGGFWFARGFLREGIALIEAALSRREESLPYDRARAMIVLANLAGEAGDPARALELSEASLALARATGDAAFLARVLVGRGIALRWGGRPVEAISVLEESIAMNPGDDHAPSPWNPIALANLGSIFIERDERARGIALVEEALLVSRTQDFPDCTALVLARLGHVDQVDGNVARSAARYGECLRLNWETGMATHFDRALVGLAGLAAKRGWHEAAAHLLGVVEEIQERTGTVDLRWPDVRDRAAESAKTVLGETGFAMAVTAGRRLPSREAEALALEIADALATGADLAGPFAAAPPLASSAALADLTAREREVFVLLARRLSDKEIAEALFISHRTVESHAKSLYAKLGVANRRDVAALALRMGLV